MKRILLGLVALLLCVALPQQAFAQTTSQSKGLYVALGDSVAAGAGLQTYGERAAACGRSMDAYPKLVANQEGMLLKNYTCSGAKIDNLIDETQSRGGYTYGPQIRNAFAETKPDVITMTVGANDLRWNEFLYNCYINDDQCGTRLGDSALVGLRWDMRRELRNAMDDIQRRSNGDEPRVYLTGYFNPVKTSTQCRDIEGITTTEIRWITKQVGLINTSLRWVANEYDFVTFVPVSFSGHELCTKDPWIQGREAVEQGGVYHPNEAGHQAYAKALTGQIR